MKMEVEEVSCCRQFNAASGFQYISEDVVGMVSSFLDFADMASASQCAKAWYFFGRREIFKRNAEKRWDYNPKDFGMGESLGLYGRSMFWNMWKQRILVREEIQRATKSVTSVKMKIKKASMFVVQQADTALKAIIYTIEGCRWIVEWFDRVQRIDMKVNESFLTPQVRMEFLHYISGVMNKHRDDMWVQHLGAKATGILAICEANRAKMVKCGNILSLANALQFLMNDQNWNKTKSRLVIPNVLWSLVVNCRPMGGKEGEPYMRDEREKFEHIHILSQLKTIDLVLNLLKSDAEPSVLAKGFWLTVNLALVDEVKEKIIANDGIESILAAMRRFPDHEEMQYRANFALINLCIRSPAKDIMLRQDGIPLVINAMRRFSESYLMQKCCTNVIRSLLNQDTVGCRNVLAAAGAVEALQHIIHTYENHSLRYSAIAALNAIS